MGMAKDIDQIPVGNAENDLLERNSALFFQPSILVFTPFEWFPGRIVASCVPFINTTPWPHSARLGNLTSANTEGVREP
jgi:hypothetical protein